MLCWIFTFFLISDFRWMDPTIPPSLPVCDRRPVGPPCWGEEVVSACQMEASYGFYDLLVWTPNLFLRFWTIVGKPSFCFCPCQRDKTKSCNSHLAACGLVSGHYHSPQAICGSGMVSRLCLTPRVLIQQFPPTSLNMKYRVKPDSFSVFYFSVVTSDVPANVSQDFYTFQILE